MPPGITGRLERVIATHDHDDHIGGMVGVPASTRTAANLRTYLSSHAIAPRLGDRRDTLALGPADVTVTVPNPPTAPGTDLSNRTECHPSP